MSLFEAKNKQMLEDKSLQPTKYDSDSVNSESVLFGKCVKKIFTLTFF